MKAELDSPADAHGAARQGQRRAGRDSPTSSRSPPPPTRPRRRATSPTRSPTATVEERTDELHTYIDKILPGLEAQLDEQPNPELQQQLAQLQTLRESEDPTIQVQTAATPPSGPASPRKALSIAIGVLAGLILGIAAAFAIQVLDPRLRREEQLRRLYRLPILARIPAGAGARRATR